MQKAPALIAIALTIAVAGCANSDGEPAASSSATSSASTTAESIPEAFDNLMDSADDLESARQRAEDSDATSQMPEIVVNEEFMAELAAMPDASAELLAFAGQVASGEHRWSEIESAQPLPREVVELKEAPNVVWQWSDPAPR